MRVCFDWSASKKTFSTSGIFLTTWIYKYELKLDCFFIKFQKTHRDPTSREVFTCHLCPQTFLYTRSLSGHVKSVHGKDRNYQCKFCNRKFSQKSCMRTHIDAQHTSSEDPRYSCGSCEYKTDYKGNFDQHKRKHEIDRKNQSCYFCGKTFTTFYGLARHCRQFHTREKL